MASGASASQPPRRTFGSRTVSTSASASGSGSASIAAAPSLAAPFPTRSRSSSAVSTTHSPSTSPPPPTGTSQWLNWVPKGEGRGREFLSNTLNGVASVASTVGHDINGLITHAASDFARPGHSRPNSFSASSPPAARPGAAAAAAFAGVGTGTASPASVAALSPASPPAPIHAASAPHVPRRAPQPSNLSRLGTAPAPALSTSPRGPAGPTRSASSALALAPDRRASHSHARTLSTGFTLPPGASPALSRSSSVADPGPSRRAIPYKIGFQPSGVRSDRTEEYTDARHAAGAEREKEEGRLGRRWAKLIDLHFNPTLQSTPPALPRSPSSSLSLSSIANTDRRRSLLSLDGALDAIKPKDVWRGIKSTAAGPVAEAEARKRAAEQAIVKWEDDAEVKKCRICQASFSLSNRKHHCRLCGRIVCSLPPTPPALLAVQIQLFSPASSSASSSGPARPATPPLPAGTRREKCSLVLVADWKTGRGEEVDEGFLGWMRVDDEKEDGGIRQDRADRTEPGRAGRRVPSASGASANGTGSGSDRSSISETQGPVPKLPSEVQVKGVRVCRECWAVVSRKQKMADRQKGAPLQRLYAALRAIQAEVDDLMPDFEAELETFIAEPADGPSSALTDAYRLLVALFAKYDGLVKRLVALPAAEGGSQAAVQAAIARTAAAFVGKARPKVQSLPQIQRKAALARASGIEVLETTLAEQLRLEGADAGAAVDAAVLLQPLLEQEAQLESYVSDANAQRKYEDAKALAEALADIRAEIERVTERAIS
ncbi:carboxypeptidase Y-deficient [Cryptotrichosporon argae]